MLLVGKQPYGFLSHIRVRLQLDLYDHKLDLIQENAHRLGVADRVQTQKLDARKVYEFFGRTL